MGLTKDNIGFTDEAFQTIIQRYTREAGVRSLERRIADLLRKAAREVAGGKTAKIKIDTRKARAWLGPRRFPADPPKRTADPGVATGLAWTEAGGEILQVCIAHEGEMVAQRICELVR